MFSINLVAEGKVKDVLFATDFQTATTGFII